MDVSAARLDRVGALDVSGLAYNSYLQGAAYDPVTRQWCLAQSDPRTKSGDREDALFHLFDAAGKPLGQTMLLPNGGHPSVFDFHDGQVWHAWERYDTAGKKAGRDVCRIPFKAGTVPRSTVKPYPMFKKWERAHLDGDRVISNWVNSSGDEFWTRRNLTDVLAGVDKPGKTLELKDHGTFQGGVSDGNDLLRVYGATSAVSTWLYRNAWSSDDWSRLDLDELLKGVDSPLTPAERALSYEFEGLTVGPDGRPTVGLRLGPPGVRRLFLLLAVQPRPVVVLKP